MATNKIILPSVYSHSEYGYNILLMDKNPKKDLFEPEKDKIVVRYNKSGFINSDSDYALQLLGIDSVKAGIAVSTLKYYCDKLLENRKEALELPDLQSSVDTFETSLNKLESEMESNGIDLSDTHEQTMLTARADTLLDSISYALAGHYLGRTAEYYFKTAERYDAKGMNVLGDKFEETAAQMIDPLFGLVESEPNAADKEKLLNFIHYLRRKYSLRVDVNKLQAAKETILNATTKQTEEQEMIQQDQTLE